MGRETDGERERVIETDTDRSRERYRERSPITRCVGLRIDCLRWISVTQYLLSHLAYLGIFSPVTLLQVIILGHKMNRMTGK